VLTKKERDVSRAVERLLLQDIVTRVDPWVAEDHQGFRRHACYSEAVDTVLKRHEDSLVNIFTHFADTEGVVSGKRAKEKTVLKLSEWINMLKDLELFDDFFTARDATVVFVLSRMRVGDEESDGAALKLENLSLEDWYEALCRVAVRKALPTDAEVEAAGAADAGDFLLRLKDAGSDYDEWVEKWNADHDAPMVKATQPAHRCVEQLILLMVRTIEQTLARLTRGNVAAGISADLSVSKKELGKFGGRGAGNKGKC
jgi:hypothetical protein